MVTVPTGIVGCEFDLGAVSVTDEVIRRYALALGDTDLLSGGVGATPLGLALALRGEASPALEMAPHTISVHGGHTITASSQFGAGHAYRVSSCLTGVFEKSGRSGALTVIGRRSVMRTLDHRAVATVDEQEIVRWAGSPDNQQILQRPALCDVVERATDSTPAVDLSALELGAIITQRWTAPSAAAIAAYAQFIGAASDSLFTDAALARRLGYADVIVPGPVQSAAVEAMLRRRVRGVVLARLSLTFRMSISADEQTTMTAIVVEHRPCPRGIAAVCDVALENPAGERVALGSAELHPD